MPIQLKFTLPQILDQFSEEELIKAIPKIKLRKIYWDDLQEGDSVTFRVELSEKLLLLFALLSGNYNPLYINQTFLEGDLIVPESLLLGFISAVGGCYLGGENIFLVEKRKAEFYSPIKLKAKTLIIRDEIIEKYSKEKKGKSRYYADLKQPVYIEEKGKRSIVAETGALAGILKKTRPQNEELNELIPEVVFTFPEILSQLSEDDLRKNIGNKYEKKDFKDIQIGETAEISIRVSHKMILIYALISGDYNPLHTNPEFVRNLKAFENKNIAHGALIMAWMSGIGILSLLGTGYRLIKKGSGDFKKAIKVGDEILIRLKITDKYVKIKNDIKNFYVDIQEKVLIKEDINKYIEAVTSGARYQRID